MILTGYQHDRMCPKCHYMMGTTKYEKGQHAGPCGIPENDALNDEWHAWAITGAVPSIIEDREDRARIANQRTERAQELRERSQAIPEHFDRECPNCKYVWAEGIA